MSGIVGNGALTLDEREALRRIIGDLLEVLENTGIDGSVTRTSAIIEIHEIAGDLEYRSKAMAKTLS